jgi:hypothetical protein
LYASYPRTVSHDGTSVSWSPTQYPKVWCPNIDTMFFARVLIGVEVICALAAAVYTPRKTRAASKQLDPKRDTPPLRGETAGSG